MRELVCWSPAPAEPRSPALPTAAPVRSGAGRTGVLRAPVRYPGRRRSNARRPSRL